MKKNSWVLVVATTGVVMLTSSPVMAAMSCTDAYQDAMANINSGETTRAENATAYNKYCRADGSFDSFNYSVGLEKVVEGLPIKAQLTARTVEQKMSQFCQIGYQQNGFYSKEVWFTKTIVENAQKNLNDCKRLETIGIIVWHTYSAPKYITINGRYLDANTKVSMDALTFDKKVLKCSSTSLHVDRRPLVFNGANGRIDIPNDFTIQCERIPQQFDKKSYYPGANVILSLSKFNSDTYAVALPPEEFYGPELASAARSEIAALSGQKDELETKFKKLTADNALSRRLNSANVTAVHSWSEGWGDTVWPGPRFDPRHANDFQSYINTQCGPNLVGKSFPHIQVPTRDGPTILYVGTCLSKQ